MKEISEPVTLDLYLIGIRSFVSINLKLQSSVLFLYWTKIPIDDRNDNNIIDLNCDFQVCVDVPFKLWFKLYSFQTNAFKLKAVETYNYHIK